MYGTVLWLLMFSLKQKHLNNIIVVGHEIVGITEKKRPVDNFHQMYFFTSQLFNHSKEYIFD